MPLDHQTLSDLLVALKGHFDARLDNFEARLDELAAGPSEPVVGLRQAAELLGVGKETVRRVITELPESRRPVRVGKTRGAWWWRSSTALMEWWEDAHGANRPSRTRSSRTKPMPRKPGVVGGAGRPERPRQSLAERLKAL